MLASNKDYSDHDQSTKKARLAEKAHVFKDEISNAGGRKYRRELNV